MSSAAMKKKIHKYLPQLKLRHMIDDYEELLSVAQKADSDSRSYRAEYSSRSG